VIDAGGLVIGGGCGLVIGEAGGSASDGAAVQAFFQLEPQKVISCGLFKIRVL
jgi:hypothetical protein